MPVVNVLNRYSEPIEIQFDAAFNPDSPYRWMPGEVKALPQEAALFCRRRSVIKDDPITGKQTRALLIQGLDQEYDQYASAYPSGAPPLLEPRGAELLDRSNMDKDAQAVSLLPLSNPTLTTTDRDSVAPASRARRVS